MKNLLPLLIFLAPLAGFGQHGVLDNDFDADGIASFDAGAQSYNSGYDVVVQQDGKILVLGQADFQQIDDATFIIRLFPDGSIDPSFGQNGVVIIADTYGQQMAIQPDGNIVVVGEGTFNNSHALSFARLNGTNGAADNSFGINGGFYMPYPMGSELLDVAIQADGKIVATGFSTDSDTDVLIIRLNQDGTPDNSFSFDGKVVTDVNDADEARGLIIGDNGKITIAGVTQEEIGNFTNRFGLLIRYNSDGSLDNSFGTNGILVPDFIDAAVLNDIVKAESGKMYACGLIAGLSDEDILLAKFNADGSFDNSFGGTGFASTDFANANDEALELLYQPDGRILLTGKAIENNQSVGALVRHNDNGLYDDTFGNIGVVTTSIGNGNTFGGLVLQADLKILTIGTTIDQFFDSEVTVARYTSGMNVGIGEVEASFGSTLIYPNPITDNHLTVEYELTSAQSISIELIDFNGNLVSILQPEAEEAVGSYQKQLYLRNVPAGNYLLRLRTEKGAIVVKLNTI